MQLFTVYSLLYSVYGNERKPKEKLVPDSHIPEQTKFTLQPFFVANILIAL